MKRLAAAVLVMLCLSSSWLCAQSVVLTVNTASANVHKSPSTASPVIGKAPRGAVLEVTRERGSWVKVSWPAAPDGIGYVHLSAGSIAHGSAFDAAKPAGLTSVRTASESAPARESDLRPDRIGPGGQPTSATRAVYITPPTHIVGLGGRMGGSTLGFGATARVWSSDRLGIQLEVSRYALNGTGAPGRLTSIQFAPSLLYSLPDRVTDYVWVRPYLGAGTNLHRQTLNVGTPGTGDSASDVKFGFQAFGGSELTFASMPRFAVSADLGYQWARAPFAGFEFGGLALSISGHWYVK